MARPNWEYVRIDVLLPDNPKLDGLGAAAKWTLIELWCYCGQHLTDGFVRDAAWKRYGTSAIRRQLAEHGLAEHVAGGWQMHDYLDHQRSREEVVALKAKRAESGRKGGLAKANAKQVPEQKPEQVPKQTASKSLAEAEAEAEVLVAEVDQSSIRELTPEESMISMIVWEIYQATARTITDGQAAAVRDNILAGRSPDDRHAYVSSAIRKELDPRARWLNAASSHPSARTPTEAAFAAGIVPNGRPADDKTVASIAAQARQAISRESA